MAKKKKWRLGPPAAPDDKWNEPEIDYLEGVGAAQAVLTGCAGITLAHVLRGGGFARINSINETATSILEQVTTKRSVTKRQMDLLASLLTEVSEKQQTLDQQKGGSSGGTSSITPVS